MAGHSAYRGAGVDPAEGQRAVALMKGHIDSTLGPGAIGGLGGFGGLFKPDLSGIADPVLVSGCDGVGTKLKVAMMAGRHDTVGIDLVAMCVNDVLCQGARPLFFLDYIAAGRIDAERIAELVKGVAAGCRMAGCSLIGGETAEMPGFYCGEDYDMAGFAVGMADEGRIVDGSAVAEGDAIIGLGSSGLHSNGFSLVRKIFFEDCGMGIEDRLPGLGAPLGEALLTPTRIYTKAVLALIEGVHVHGMAHITGGGFYENIPRILPEGLAADIDASVWERPPIFGAVQEYGGVTARDMYSTFNMGIGFVAFLPEGESGKAIDLLKGIGEDARVIGAAVGGGGVRIGGMEER